MTLDCYFDLACPYSLLAIHRLLTDSAFARCQIAWHAVDVEAVKRDAGNDGPSLANLPHKARYVREDVARWAKRYGIPGIEPAARAFARSLNGGVFLARQRGVEADYLLSVLRHCMAGGRGRQAPNLLNLVCSGIAWPAGTLAAYSESAQAELRSNECLARARAAGVFGTPTFVAAGDLWWGNDRLGQVAERLRRAEAMAAGTALPTYQPEETL